MHFASQGGLIWSQKRGKKKKGLNFQRTVHLPFVGEDYFTPATRWVDSQRLLEGLLDVSGPHAFRIAAHVI